MPETRGRPLPGGIAHGALLHYSQTFHDQQVSRSGETVPCTPAQMQACAVRPQMRRDGFTDKGAGIPVHGFQRLIENEQPGAGAVLPI